MTPLKQWRVNSYGKLPTGGGTGGSGVGGSNASGSIGGSNNGGGGGGDRTMKDKNIDKRKSKPVSPFITVVDGPFGPIVLTKPTSSSNTSNSKITSSSSSSGGGSNHNPHHHHHPSTATSSNHPPPPQDVMLLLFIDMERDCNTDIVRTFFTHFAMEIQRREQTDLRPLSTTEYNRQYTMSGYLFGCIQGKSSKEDNWRGSEYVEQKRPVGAVATAAIAGDPPVTWQIIWTPLVNGYPLIICTH